MSSPATLTVAGLDMAEPSGDISGNPKNRGWWPMIFSKNMKFWISSKLRPKRLTNARFSCQKWIHPVGPRIRPKTTQSALRMPDFATFPEISKIVGDDLWFFLKIWNFKQRQNWSQNALQMADLVAKMDPRRRLWNAPQNDQSNL